MTVLPAKTVVFLHAFPLSASMWTEQMNALAQENVQVKAIDMPGFGARDGKMSTLNRAAQMVIDEMPKGRVALVGLSMGGYVALEILHILQQRDQASRISHVVLADTHASGDDDATKVRRQQQADYTRQVGLQWLINNAHVENPPHTARLYEKMIAETDPEAVAAALEAMAGRLPRKKVLMRLREDEVPFLALVGERDPITTPDTMRKMAHMAQGQMRVIPGAGHLSNLDMPAAFTAELQNFLLKK